MDNKFLSDFIAKVNPNDALFSNFYSAVNSGNNTLVKNVISEAITLDEGWIATAEQSLFYIEDIIKNPKKFIIDEDIIVEVERAKRTTSKTVRYLSQNSKDVSKIDEKGFVTPKRVLTTQINEDIAIYENRFICSLVHRLINFVETQNNLIKDKINFYDVTNIKMKSDFVYGDMQFDYDLKLSVKEPPKDQVMLEKNEHIAERILKLRNRLQIIKNTPFIRQLSALKPIQPPIIKTNIIKMNIEYANCYKLWLYLSSYKIVGFSVAVQDKNLPIDGDYFDDMTVMTALTIKSILENDKARKAIYENVEYKKLKNKKYKVVESIKYEPDFKKSKDSVTDDAVNEYYFNQMKSAFSKASNTAGKNVLKNEKVLKMNFDKFFRSVSSISDQMYVDLIKQEKSGKAVIKRTPLQIKEQEYEKQKKLLKRYEQLSRLKNENLEKALRIEVREQFKLDKAKLEYLKAKDRALAKREAAKNKKLKLEKIKAKGLTAQKKADKYAEELDKREQERIQNTLEEKQRRRELAVEARELKMLEYLKNKYEK